MSGRTQRCSGARCWLREACRARWGVRTIRSRRTRDAPGIVTASAAVTEGDSGVGVETADAGFRDASAAFLCPVATETAKKLPTPSRASGPASAERPDPRSSPYRSAERSRRRKVEPRESDSDEWWDGMRVENSSSRPRAGRGDRPLSGKGPERDEDGAG